MGGDQQHRRVLQVVDEPREVLVGRRVDPVQVLDDDQQRPPAAGLEQHETQRVQRALAHALQRRVVERGEAVLDAEQLQQQRRALLGVQPQRLQRRARLGRHRVRRVALLDAALAAHEIEDRQVGNRRAVRAAARLQRRHLDAAERAPELVEQPRLAAAGVADDAHQAAAPGLRLGQQLAEPAQLALAPHEAPERALGGVLEGRLPRRHADDLVGGDRIALALDGERTGRQQPQLAPHQTRGGLGDQDLAGRGGLLQPGGDVGRVADGGVVHAQVVADGADHDEARVESHAHGQLGARPEAGVRAAILQRTADLEGGHGRAAGVVLVGQRRAEQRHEAVAEELVDGALVAMDLGQRQLEESIEQIVHRVGAEPLGQRGRADQVAEQHGDRLPLAGQRRPRGEDSLGEVTRRVGIGRRRPRRVLERRRGGDRRAAGVTELGAGWQGCPTGRARQRQRLAALEAEARAGRVLVVTAPALHDGWTRPVYVALYRLRKYATRSIRSATERASR